MRRYSTERFDDYDEDTLKGCLKGLMVTMIVVAAILTALIQITI